jgi:Glycosyl hydrolase family 20, domain 2
MPYLRLSILLAFWAAVSVVAKTASQGLETNPQAVARCLASLDAWIVAQPKAVRPLPGVSFSLARCKGIVLEGAGQAGVGLSEQASAAIAIASGVQLPVLKRPASGRTVRLVMLADPRQFAKATGLGAELFEQIGDQGYALVIDAKQAVLAARAIPGLRHGITTLEQIAIDRTVLPGLVVCDWPCLKYRGAQQDISRGQVPTTAALKRLASVLAQAKMNELELYIEHEYKFKTFPDISPPEGLAPAEAQDLAACAAQNGLEVHPLLQTLGHSYHILNKPQYQHLRVGPCEKAPWIMTFDVRKPEAVRMVTTMIDELCETFPGELFNVDITEIDIDGLQTNGVTVSQATDLVFGYVLQLNAAVRKHHKRLMIAQGPLDSQGHLAGMGPKLDRLPNDIIIGSYYCAGGPYQPAWEKDYPRLQEKRLDFFAQAWIYSHVWLTPWVKAAAEFSDLEVSRGLRHGAIGSITTDWGDAGHFHFVGEEWLPFLYHGACAWTGAQFDRAYFRRAVARVMYGLRNDAALRAMEAASDVNAKRIRIRDQEGKESEIATTFIWEFVHDPFTHPDLTRIANPCAVGQMILDTARPALAALSVEALQAKRNRDNLEQWTFGVRCYVALGRKLLALGRYKDPAVPRSQVADELAAVADEYESLQTEFKRLWLGEDRDNDGFQELVRRFTYTIGPCREKAKALREAVSR